MDKNEFNRFVKYYSEFRGRSVSVVDHMYEKFGREFIHSLPIEYEPDGFGYRISVIESTQLWHSVTEPAVIYTIEPEFYIFGHYMTLDQWLPYSALTSEEQLLYKLKYG